MITRRLLSTSIILTIAATLGGCHTHLNERHETPVSVDDYPIERVIENIVYSPADWPQPLMADLYLPQKPGLHPVVLMVHGGGWANRSRDDMAGISRKLARHGYAVFNVSYRFAPRYTYPAQLHDMALALQWIAANAQAYNLDTERVNAWGYSSGAHLAALIASVDKPETAIDTTLPLPRIQSVVAGGIPSDLRKYSGSPIVMRFMGGDRHEMPERYADASPAFHVSSDDPPVFLYHGKLDFLVSTDQATDYYEALTAANVDAELYLQGWRGHMTMFLFGGDAEKQAISFLNRNNRPEQLLAADQN